MFLGIFLDKYVCFMTNNMISILYKLLQKRGIKYILFPNIPRLLKERNSANRYKHEKQ